MGDIRHIVSVPGNLSIRKSLKETATCPDSDDAYRRPSCPDGWHGDADMTYDGDHTLISDADQCTDTPSDGSGARVCWTMFAAVFG